MRPDDIIAREKQREFHRPKRAVRSLRRIGAQRREAKRGRWPIRGERRLETRSGNRRETPWRVGPLFSSIARFPVH